MLLYYQNKQSFPLYNTRVMCLDLLSCQPPLLKLRCPVNTRSRSQRREPTQHHSRYDSALVPSRVEHDRYDDANRGWAAATLP